MASAQLKAALRDTAEATIGERASFLTKGRVMAAIDEIPDEPGAVEATLERIRKLVFMFVDEDLAGEVHEQLRRTAGL